MIYSNLATIGCVVSFQHDIADIPCSVAKYFGQTVYTKTAVFFFSINMVLWAYTRNILLPYVIYRIVTENLDFPAPFEEFWVIPAFAAAFLSVMCVLHYYWYVIFVKMMLNFKEKGEAEDL